MILTNKHITYENDCQKIFVGQTICAVIYGEVKYSVKEDENSPEPYYKTKYPDIDTLDYSIYFKTDNKTIYVFWDNTFFSYGLKAKPLDLTEEINDYEQKWDVSSDPKWQDFIGQIIIDFKIIWRQVSTSNLDGTNSIYSTYPQTFKIRTKNGKTIILSASEFKNEEENEVYPLSDNLLVTTNIDLAKQFKLIE